MKKELTSLFVERLQTPATGQMEIHDTHRLGRGLSLRLSAGGTKTWNLSYRNKRTGKNQRLKIGRYPVLSLKDARSQAQIQFRDIQLGGDPIAERKQAEQRLTFGQLAARYMDEWSKPRKRTWREDERSLKVDILPFWHDRIAAEIKKGDVREILQRIAARGKRIAANRVLALVSSIFSWAIAEQIVDEDLPNPCFKMRKPGVETPRDRVLTDEEIRAMWMALDRERPATQAIFKLALLTGQRRSEVVGLCWSELILEGGAPAWTLPSARAKNGVEHKLPLTGQALEILRGLRADADPGEARVFPGRSALAAVQAPMNHIRRQLDARDIRFHDLRRSFVTRLAELLAEQRLDPGIVGRLVNHVESDVTARHYLRATFHGPMRRALSIWDAHLRGLIDPTSAPAKVVNLDGSAVA